MKTYTIYHIPGVKIGCTNNLKKRLKQLKLKDCEILETHTDIDIASNREVELQIQFGYTRDCSKFYKDVIEFKREYKIGQKRTLETRKNISESLKGRKLSEEQLNKMRGRKLSEETKQKIREKRKLQIFTEETRQKMSKSRSGKKYGPRTEEWCKNISESLKGHIPWNKGRKNGNTRNS